MITETVGGVEYAIDGMSVSTLRLITAIGGLLKASRPGLSAKELIAESETLQELIDYVIGKCVTPRPPNATTKMQLINVISREVMKSVSSARAAAKK